ncbi:Phosphoribosylamine--glycine ligase [Nymphon striatum]|nr:Phosphoribosylamine--glycine ligase [Nymphon striatum]
MITELKDIPVIGPEKAAAELEGSKEFAKKFMMRHNIPTAAYQSFTTENLEEGYTFLDNNLEEAKEELRTMLVDAKFGNASATVVIEEFLAGIELSVFVLTDGKGYKVLPTAKDYKRIGEGDAGLNTGGMGAISPVPFADQDFMDKIHQRVVIPTVEGLKKDNLPYKGFIFIGLIKVDNDPFVIEYNVRLGDPETEVMSAQQLQVMLVSGGYPEAYEKGKEITGYDSLDDSLAFHAGTTLKDGKVVTNGGRVMAITSFGNDFKEALKKSYKNIDKLHFDRMNYRKDIGFDLIGLTPLQWHYEDIIRDPNIDADAALTLKRKIDASNQDRTDLRLPESDASAEHLEKCKQKLQILLEQKKDLTTAIDQLLIDIESGDKYMKVYKQMKMYNDDELNPVLRGLNQLPNVTVYEADVKGKHKGVLGLWNLYKSLKELEIDAVADLHNVLRSFTIDISSNAILPKRKLSTNLQQKYSFSGKRLVGIAPFAAFEGKMYPLDLMEQVVSALSKKDNCQILLFGGGKKEQEVLENWESQYQNISSIVGKATFTEELELISNLDIMLAMDSGNAHLAALFGVPTITLWGVTHPNAGFYPFAQNKENALLADREKFPLIPTSVYGNKMPEGYTEAMRTIHPQDVINKLNVIITS